MSQDKIENIEPLKDQEEQDEQELDENELKRKQIEKQTVYYQRLEQVDLVAVDDETESLDLSQTRLTTIENFSKFKNLKSICFRNNFLKTLLTENLSVDKGFSNIIELDFYDNQIEKIENLNQLTTLEILDLSFNKFKKIENLEQLINLRKLYFVHNQITKIENLDTLVNLDMLELGDNQLKVIENLNHLTNLTQL